MLQLLVDTFFIIQICIVQSDPKFFLGVSPANLPKEPQDTDQNVLKLIQTIKQKHKQLHDHTPVIMKKIQQLNKFRDSAFNKLFGLTRSQILVTSGWINDGWFAYDIRRNWWNGGALRQPEASRVLINALSKNELFKDLKEGKIWKKGHAKWTRIKMEQFEKEAQKFWKLQQHEMDANQYKEPSISGSIWSDDEMDALDPITEFAETYYPPFSPDKQLVFYFGLKKSCDTEYVGDPNHILYGPLSVSTEYLTAASYAGWGRVGTIFKVTIPIKEVHKIGGIMDTFWLKGGFELEEEYILYNVPLSMISIENKGHQKPADIKKPCFKKGTRKQLKQKAVEEIFNEYNGYNGYHEYDGNDEYNNFAKQNSEITVISGWILILFSWLGLAVFTLAMFTGFVFSVIYYFWMESNKCNDKGNENISNQMEQHAV